MHITCCKVKSWTFNPLTSNKSRQYFKILFQIFQIKPVFLLEIIDFYIKLVSEGDTLNYRSLFKKKKKKKKKKKITQIIFILSFRWFLAYRYSSLKYTVAACKSHEVSFSLAVPSPISAYDMYRIYPKYWDTLNPNRIYPKNCKKTNRFRLQLAGTSKISGWLINSADPDQNPRSAPSYLGLHCFRRLVSQNI